MDIRIIDIMSILSFEKRSKELKLVRYILEKYMDDCALGKKSSDIIPYLEINDRRDFEDIVHNIA